MYRTFRFCIIYIYCGSILKDKFNFTDSQVIQQNLGVGNKGAAIISELFHSKLPLKSLDIGQINITAEGIDVIANNISSAKLMSLNLGYNNLRNEGVIKLLHALMANQYIKELILNETRISEKSAEVIGGF
ncbi:hypothetical protein MCI_01400 [Rickettsia montanensis str. OSU 85-930]|uniref:Uncharacterized protein n=1 Tax=Rickettsia montanensis (strain OSU 85-930) TaxID=1105114 RepID=H8KB91_RICMS|nr:hypothetical protein MCI_01400 [Rickettsia montanensis str. OSU 85-930]